MIHPENAVKSLQDAVLKTHAPRPLTGADGVFEKLDKHKEMVSH